MRYYEVYGGVLRSEIDFPELSEVGARNADWTILRADAPASVSDAVVLGREQLPGGVVACLSRGHAGFRLELDDTGTFDIIDHGSTIVWSHASNSNLEIVRSDLLGRVLALALHASGDLCLHGSAAAIGDRAIAFVGGKGQGKSTLLTALLSDAASLVADDTLRLSGNPLQVAVALPSVRLCADAVACLQVEAQRAPVGEKFVLRDASMPAVQWLPLAAVYVIVPRQPQVDAPVVRRRELSSLQATLALVRCGKSAELLGRGEAGITMQRASAVARAVPVFTLEIVRDLNCLSRVAARIRHWHEPAEEPLSA